VARIRDAMFSGLGAAGLLPSQRPLQSEAPPELVEEERLWRRHRALGTITTPWQLFRVRPENAPARRVAAAAAMVERFLPAGLPASLVDGLRRLVDRKIVAPGQRHSLLPLFDRRFSGERFGPMAAK
jgi:hypothetical protein